MNRSGHIACSKERQRCSLRQVCIRGLLRTAYVRPGENTIQGVRALEEGGLRQAVMNAVIAAFEKKF